MSPGNDLSAADRAAIDALAVCHVETQKAVAELARVVADRYSLDKPRSKGRRFVMRDGEAVEVAPAADAPEPVAEPVRDVHSAGGESMGTNDAEPRPSVFSDVFGSPEADLDRG